MKELFERPILNNKLDDEHIEALGDTLQGKIARLSKRFVVISENQILNFLSNKILSKVKSKYLNWKHDPVQRYDYLYHTIVNTPTVRIVVKEPGFFGRTLITKLSWMEECFEKYQKIVPKNVALKYKQVNDEILFDRITIATLRYEEIEPDKDPLLIGRIADSSLRFVLAQWDNDILLDDLL